MYLEFLVKELDRYFVQGLLSTLFVGEGSFVNFKKFIQ